MPKLPILSGKDLVKALIRLDFVVVRQKGSHVFLQKGKRTTVVPLHKIIKKGTLKAILRQTGLNLENLIEVL